MRLNKTGFFRKVGVKVGPSGDAGVWRLAPGLDNAPKP